ncbi:hypothetical protein [Streptomyces sp. NPDC087512]|uniref:hypothetical protein n=1 Tax=unclassified Streptomyces TaxID=2593676 RepID=UPI003430D9CF
MGTKTVDETAVKTDQDQADEVDEAARDEDAANTPADGDTTAAEGAAADDTDADATDAAGAGREGPTGVGQGAGAVVSAGLGVVSLSGSWVGSIASARESLLGQLQTSSSSNVATLLQKGYGNAWQAEALWGGVFALVALIVGVVVLARPAFGAPGRPQAPWIKSVAWGGVALGVIGLILAVLKYTDVLLNLPSAG